MAVAAVGGAGAVLRFVVDGAVAGRFGRQFPLGTLVINVSGAFVLGLLTGLALKGTAMLIAGTAAIGSFTTFSTWMFETQRLAEDGEPWYATVNVLASVALGIGAALLGRTLGLHL
jgi:CrcB protein